MMHLDPNLHERLKMPERSLIVSIPVRMDDDTVRMFTGYRVQHDSSRGPSKGGVRYHPHVDLGEVAAVGQGVEGKWGVGGVAFGRAEGGRAGAPEERLGGRV